MKIYQDIPYTSHPDATRRLDIYRLDGACRATLVWLHGGGLEGGDRKAGVEALAATFGLHGISLVSVEYRMYPEHAFPTFLEDAAAAVRWTVDHAAEYALSERIVLGGSSAGGYISMMLCLDRQWLEGVGLTPEDISAYLLDAGQPTTHFNILKYRGEDPRLARIDESAPLYHIRDARPGKPLYITVSDNDIPCRLEQNQLLAVTLKHFGYDPSLIELRVVEGFPHTGYVWAPDEAGRVIYGELASAFLEKHLF